MSRNAEVGFLALPVLGALGAAIIGLAIKIKGGTLVDMAVPACTVFICMGLVSVCHLLAQVNRDLRQKI